MADGSNGGNLGSQMGTSMGGQLGTSMGGQMGGVAPNWPPSIQQDMKPGEQ